MIFTINQFLSKSAGFKVVDETTEAWHHGEEMERLGLLNSDKDNEEDLENLRHELKRMTKLDLVSTIVNVSKPPIVVCFKRIGYVMMSLFLRSLMVFNYDLRGELLIWFVH